MKIKPGTKLFIATPCYGAQLHAGYHSSLMMTSHMLWRANLLHKPSYIAGDSLITRARNVLVAQFMATEFTHLLFIDGDIQWQPESVLRLLAASSEHEVCCGIYPKKCLPVEFPVNFLHGADKVLNQHPVTGYVEIKDAPTGFLMITKQAIIRMMLAYPERQCILRQDTPEDERPFEYALFDCLIDGKGRVAPRVLVDYQFTNQALARLRARKPRRHYLSEDFGFSRLWQRIGGQVWMDPEIRLVHYGQHAYTGAIKSVLVAAGDTPNSAEDIQGWMGPDELEFLRGAAGQVDSIAEIGCWKGRSTFALLSGCDGPVYAVDHWQGSEDERDGPHAEAVTGDVFAEFHKNVGHFPNLRVVRKPSTEAAAEVPAVDMVFIDGGHRFEDVIADIRAWKPKARKIICGHDYNYPEVARAVAEELGAVQAGPGSIWIKEVA